MVYKMWGVFEHRVVYPAYFACVNIGSLPLKEHFSVCVRACDKLFGSLNITFIKGKMFNFNSCKMFFFETWLTTKRVIYTRMIITFFTILFSIFIENRLFVASAVWFVALVLRGHEFDVRLLKSTRQLENTSEFTGMSNNPKFNLPKATINLS